MTKTKSKPESVLMPPPKAPESSSSAEMSPGAARQFEVELCWCIQQLQTALSLGKLNAKQSQDHTKALNTLMSKAAPTVKKRQVMRLSFGDYRTKMAAEDKRLSKATQQIKVLPAKPSAKSMFVRKSTLLSGSNSFKFNFDIPNTSENTMQVDTEVTQQIEDSAVLEPKIEKQEHSSSSFHFLPSDNNFKFDFSVTS